MSDDTTLPCPVLTTFDLAERFLEANAGRHQQLEEAMELIRREREVAEAVHAVLPCTPVIADGQLRCPLARVGGDVMALALSRIEPSVHAVPLADDVSIGAML